MYSLIVLGIAGSIFVVFLFILKINKIKATEQRIDIVIDELYRYSWLCDVGLYESAYFFNSVGYFNKRDLDTLYKGSFKC